VTPFTLAKQQRVFDLVLAAAAADGVVQRALRSIAAELVALLAVFYFRL
jgi:hypothetical protein